jgi:VanZ family protein
MFLKHNLYGLLWALLILVLCGIPGKDIPHVSFLELLNFDKFVHASIFFILTLLFIRGFGKQTSFEYLHAHPRTAAFTVCVLYGGSLEIMQGTIFVDRSADILDFIANSFGASVGLLLFKPIDRNILSRIKFL